MGSPFQRLPKSPLKQWVIYLGVDVYMGIDVGRKSKIIIKFSQKLLHVKEYTNVERPANCNVATSTTRQCNNNDNDNNIKQ